MASSPERELLAIRVTISYLPALRDTAGVVKLVDALDSKSCSERSVGSSPTTGTTLSINELCE